MVVGQHVELGPARLLEDSARGKLGLVRIIAPVAERTRSRDQSLRRGRAQGVAKDAEVSRIGAGVIAARRTGARTRLVHELDSGDRRAGLACGGQEALELMRRARTLDLVLTDHAMPEMTGLQLAARIAAERPGLKVILATGYADFAPDEAAHLPRLAKPYDQATLARMIDAVMRGAEEAGGDGTVVPFPKSA